MTRRSRRRRERRRLARLLQTSNDSPTICVSLPDNANTCVSDTEDGRIKRALGSGGITSILMGFVFVITQDNPKFNVIGVLAIIFGVFLVGCFIVLVQQENKQEDISEEDHSRQPQWRGVSSPARNSRTRTSPNFSHSSAIGRSSTNHLDVDRLASPYRANSNHSHSRHSIPLGLRLSDYASGFDGQPSWHYTLDDGQRSYSTSDFIGQRSQNLSPANVHRSHSPSAFAGQRSWNHSPVSPHHSPLAFVGQSSRASSPGRPHQTYSPSASAEHWSRNMSPIGGQSSGRRYTNRSPSPIVGGDPPPYRSVVTEEPWENPPSYEEASSCLVPRVDAGESSHPSAPDISIAITEDRNSPDEPGMYSAPITSPPTYPSAPDVSIPITEDLSSSASPRRSSVPNNANLESRTLIFSADLI